MEPLVPRDNDSSLRANLPMYLLLPEVLEELGLRAPGDPGLTFELLDGSTRVLTSDPLPIEAYRDWVFGAWGGLFPEGLPPDDDGPPYLRHRDLAFWSETLADPAGLYVGYNEVELRPSDGRSITDLAAEIDGGRRRGRPTSPSSSTCATTAVETTTPSGRCATRSKRWPTRQAGPGLDHHRAIHVSRRPATSSPTSWSAPSAITSGSSANRRAVG